MARRDPATRTYSCTRTGAGARMVSGARDGRASRASSAHAARRVLSGRFSFHGGAKGAFGETSVAARPPGARRGAKLVSPDPPDRTPNETALTREKVFDACGAWQQGARPRDKETALNDR